jgi:C-terminal processing protease CtpA/Prc
MADSTLLDEITKYMCKSDTEEFVEDMNTFLERAGLTWEDYRAHDVGVPDEDNPEEEMSVKILDALHALAKKCNKQVGGKRHRKARRSSRRHRKSRKVSRKGRRGTRRA